MVSKPKVCILSFSPIAWDSRVLREIDAARRQYQVEVIGFEEWAPPEGVVYHQVSKRQLTKIIRIPLSLGGHVLPAFWGTRYWNTPYYRRAYEILAAGHFDLIHANDWDALPVAARAAQQTGARVLYDAHEYTPGQATKKWRRWLTLPYRMYLLQKYIPRASAMITVSEGLQDLYRNNYGWNAELIRNVPHYQQATYHPVDPQRVCLIHHGIANSVRRIDSFIDLMSFLDDRFHLTLMLIPTDAAYLAGLKEQAARVAPGRITFLDPVTPPEVIPTISQHDIGIPLVIAEHVSYQNALPNKFFDSIMAGLALGVTPLRVMKKYVETYQIGVVAAEETLPSLAGVLNALTPDQINAYKQNSLALARTLNAETEMEKLMGIYQRLLDQPAPN